MKPLQLKVARIGNSRGVRIPAPTLARYEIGETVIMEERSDGILLRPTAAMSPKLSWAETARDMAKSDESWSDWDATSADGLDALPWDAARSRKVAESKEKYSARRTRKK